MGMKGKQYWSANIKAMNLRMADTSYDALKAEAETRGVSMSTLTRYFIERGLGLSVPGMGNVDHRLWPEPESHY
jgi:hypothetical protein